MKKTFDNYTNKLLERRPAGIGAVIFTEDGECRLKVGMWTYESQSDVMITMNADELRQLAAGLLKTADEIDAIILRLNEAAA